MAEIVAIGYPDETTAPLAMSEAEHLAGIRPDAIASIVRSRSGRLRVTTNHHEVAGAATWGMWWGFLVGLLFFVPFRGMAVGAGLGALTGKLGKSAVDRKFEDEVRDMLKPGTSALFLVLEQVTPDSAVEALGKYGGTVLKSSLSKDAEAELQEALRGTAPVPA